MNSLSDIQAFIKSSASEELRRVIERSLEGARAAHRDVHLATLVKELLQELPRDVVPQDVRSKAEGALNQQLSAFAVVSQSKIAFRLDSLIDPAKELARKVGGQSEVTSLPFLAACLNPAIPVDVESQRTREILRGAGLTLESLLAPADPTDFRTNDFRFERLGFGTNLTAKAAAGVWSSCPLVGMDAQLRQLIQVINSEIHSAVLIGEAGVGKSAIVNGLAYKIADKDPRSIPKHLHGVEVILIEAHDILQSAGAVGGLERELKRILSFFQKNPLVIPFFDELHGLLDTTDDTLKAVATALKPAMANGVFRCIGATTNREYNRFILNDLSLRSRFQQIQLHEPDAESAAAIVKGARRNLLEGRAGKRGIKISDGAITASINVTTTYQRAERLPRKAIKLLQMAVSDKLIALDLPDGDPPDPEVSARDVAMTFSNLSGIPVDALDADRSRYYRLVAERLSDRVMGQDSAIRAVTEWLALHAAGWVDPRRPRGRFVFTGAPGVGKSELARGLAEELMADPQALFLIDMGDYQDDMAVSKFMGASPGYTGFGETSNVYGHVNTRPYSVIVFDEFEKCNPKLANPLLAILDGSAEDSRGNRVDFSQTIIIFTSNVVGGIPDGHQDASREDREQRLRTSLREYKSPRNGERVWTDPLLDRIDRVCGFDLLSDDVLVRILDSQIAFRERVAAKPLPPGIHDFSVKRDILAAAGAHGGHRSARRLERALLDWLLERANRADLLVPGAVELPGSADLLVNSES